MKRGITLLSKEQIYGDNRLEIINKCGTCSEISDYACLLGGISSGRSATRNRTGRWWIKDGYKVIKKYGIYDTRKDYIDANGSSSSQYIGYRSTGGRPVLPYDSISFKAPNEKINEFGIKEVEYGEYPQTIVEDKLSAELEKAFDNGNIIETGKTYTSDSYKGNEDQPIFEPRKHVEYLYKGKKYIRFVSGISSSMEFLDEKTSPVKKNYWVAIEPITWLVDEKANIALSKKILFAGVQFSNNRIYDGNFEESDIMRFMDNFFIKEIEPSMQYSSNYSKANDRKGVYKKNPAIYGLKEIIIPEGITELDDSAFSYCTSLRRITLPKSLIKIGDYAFHNCHLEEIIIPKKVEEIGKYSFAYCSNLKSISLPNSLRKIGQYSFYECQSLKNIKIPEGVEEIQFRSFGDCLNLESIYLPSTLKVVGKNILLCCPSLKNITLNANEHIIFSEDDDTYENRFLRSDINIIYKNFDNLNSFINNNLKIFKEYAEYNKGTNNKITFTGPKLSRVNKIDLLINIKTINNIVFQELDTSQEVEKEKTVEKEDINIYSNDEEIEKLLTRIKELIFCLPENQKEIINKKINRMLEEYKEKYNSLKPQYNYNNRSIVLRIENATTLKLNLIRELQKIIFELESNNIYYQQLIDLKNYRQQIIKATIKENNHNRLETILNNILQLLPNLGIKLEREIKDELLEYINLTIAKIENEVNNTSFASPNTNKYILDLELFLSNLYEKLQIILDKTKEFEELLDKIRTEEIEYLNKSDINYLISSIKYIISIIPDEKYKKEFRSKIFAIIEKYIAKIYKIINNKQLLLNTSCGAIEIELRTELQELLNSINANNYFCPKLLEIKTKDWIQGKNEKMIKYLKLCKKLTERKQVSDWYSTDLEIIRIIYNIIDTLVDSKLMRMEVKDTIRKELILVFDKYINKYTNEVNGVEEYYRVLKELTREVTIIEFKMDNYIEEEEEYSKEFSLA